MSTYWEFCHCTYKRAGIFFKYKKVDRFSSRLGFQYFRAHFGLAPPTENVIFRLATPRSLCSKDDSMSLFEKTKFDFRGETPKIFNFFETIFC